MRRPSAIAPFSQDGRDEEAAVLLLGCVLERLLLREGGCLHVVAHDVRQAADGVERGLHALQVVLGDGREAVDDGVQVDRHLRNLLVRKADARVLRDVAHIMFGYMLGHGVALPFSFSRIGPRQAPAEPKVEQVKT